MADIILVNIVDANDQPLADRPFRFKAEVGTPVGSDEIFNTITKKNEAWKEGELQDDQGFTVATGKKEVPAGTYTYRVTKSVAPARAAGGAGPAASDRLAAALSALATAQTSSERTVAMCAAMLKDVATMHRKPTIKVTAENMGSGTAAQVQGLLDRAFHVQPTYAPCCARTLRPLRRPDVCVFKWPHRQENNDLNVEAALQHMQDYLLPLGMFAWPVQGINWLNCMLDCQDAFLQINNSQTDYILFMAGPNNEVRDLVAALSRSLRQHLTPLVPWMVAFLEAKTEARLRSHTAHSRCQALLEYVAVNQARPNGTAPLLVVLSDFNKYHCVHSGGTSQRGGLGPACPCIHVAHPHKLHSVPERRARSTRPATAAAAHAAAQPAGFMSAPSASAPPMPGGPPASAPSASAPSMPGGPPAAAPSASAPSMPGGPPAAAPSASARPMPGGAPAAAPSASAPSMPGGAPARLDLQTLQFVQTLLAEALEVRQRETAGRTLPEIQQLTEQQDPPGDDGGDDDGAASMEEDVEGDDHEPMDVQAAEGAPGRQMGPTSTHYDQGAGGGQDHLLLDFEVSCPDVCSSSSSSHASGSVDEGLHEAAVENANAQQFMALLRQPAVYQSLGLTRAPSSYTPPTKEEFWRSFRLLPLPGGQQQ